MDRRRKPAVRVHLDGKREKVGRKKELGGRFSSRACEYMSFGLLLRSGGAAPSYAPSIWLLVRVTPGKLDLAEEWLQGLTPQALVTGPWYESY